MQVPRKRRRLPFLLKVIPAVSSGRPKKAVSLSSRQDFQRVLELFPGMDVVYLFIPLYVDGFPSYVLEFLIQAEKYCKSYSCRSRLYALSNNGFVEGK